MRNIVLIPLAAIALGAAGTAAVAGKDQIDSSDAALAKATAGLVPGKPMTCLYDRSPSTLTAAGPNLIYRVTNRLVYVNKTTGGCESVARGDTLVTRSFGSGLCRGDIAQTVNLPARFPTGSCALGDFVPYRRP